MTYSSPQAVLEGLKVSMGRDYSRVHAAFEKESFGRKTILGRKPTA